MGLFDRFFKQPPAPAAEEPNPFIVDGIELLQDARPTQEPGYRYKQVVRVRQALDRAEEALYDAEYMTPGFKDWLAQGRQQTEAALTELLKSGE